MNKAIINDYLGILEEEIIGNNEIKVSLVENRIDIYNDIARVMADRLKINNEKGRNTSFILPVGPCGQYKRFVRICNEENITCKNLITINMDEYLDDSDNYISESHPMSFRGFMRRGLFDLLNNDLKIKKENIFFPNPKKLDEVTEIIEELGGADICFGGIGINGHIAFNEPLNSDDGGTVDQYKKFKTRILNVAKDTIIINSIKYGGYTELVPRRCITIGMFEILLSKELRFYLEHNWQSAVLRKTLYQEQDPGFPATLLRMHKNCSLIISSNVLDRYV